MRRRDRHRMKETVSSVVRINLWVSVIFLCCIGLIMVYSASAYRCGSSEKYQYNSFYFLQRQAMYMGLGLVACFAAQHVHYGILYRFALWIYVVSIGTVFLLLSSLGVSANGATRWVNLGGIQFQVAEVVKIGVIIGLAYMVQRYRNALNRKKLLIYMWVMGGTAVVLVKMISNDLSSAIVILGITVGITFIYTKTLKVHLIAGGVVVSALCIYLWYIWNHLPTAAELENMSFRVGRIAAWLKPELYASDVSYQTLQALYAIGRGGIFGQGLGNSIQKLSVLPEAQNDMIFSILCEEMGIVGASMLIILFLYLFYCLYQVITRANDLFGSVLATGTLLHISVQTLINISVNLNLIPNTGIALPFISYGGTAVFCQLLEIAMVLSVERVTCGCRVINFCGKYENFGRR